MSALDAPVPRAEPPFADRRRAVIVVALAIFSVSIAYLTWRGLVRGLANSSDLVVGYAAGQAWLLGHDPYDVAVLVREALSIGGPDTPVRHLDRLLNVYFPTTLPIFVPLSLLSWPDARLTWLSLNLVSTVFIALGVARLSGWGVMAVRTLAFSSVVFALAPVHTTMSLGQTAVLATGCLVGALMLERSGHPRAAGLLYALATAVKIQIGLPFLAYLVWRRRWETTFHAALWLIGITVLSVVRMELANIAWFESWTANLGLLSGPGGLNDPGRLNSDRYSLISLEYPLHSLFAHASWVSLISAAVIAALAAAFAWIVRVRDILPDLLSFGIVAVLGLLATYHRYYDAVLLVLPIAWAISTLGTSRWREGTLALVLCADFLLPAQTALNELQQRGFIPDWLADSLVWESVLMAQHAWALVLLAILLLRAAVRTARIPEAEPLVDPA